MPRKGENIYRRKDGRWEGRVRIERKRYISVYAHSYGEAKHFILSGTDDPIEPARLRKEFLHILKSCGLPHMKFHTLRHIFASSCIRQVFDVAAVSEMLGHSNKSMTLDRYTHSSIGCMAILFP